MLLTIEEYVADAKQACHCLSVEDAQAFMREPGCLMIDVREPEEHLESSLPGFINIPRGVLEMRILSLCPHESHPILLHCATGGRASLAAAALQKLGYSNVKLIDAGFDTLVCQIC